MAGIRENLANIRQRIRAAAARCGRNPEAVRLVAVSKTFPAAAVREAFDAGQRDFGENRVQEAEAKWRELSGLGVTLHLIGHLQSNKALRAAKLCDWVQSLDSIRIARKLSDAAAESGKRLPVLMEVNLGGEEAKSGVSETEAPVLAEQIAKMPGLDLRGLMVIPPLTEDPENARPYFRKLRELAQRIEARGFEGVSMRELSMGMSQDFEIAVEEGATIVRVGTAIFGRRPAQ